jgi:hypothetical protein
MLILGIFPNILFSLVLNFFLRKIIFLKFRHSILELFSADPTIQVRYWIDHD